MSGESWICDKVKRVIIPMSMYLEIQQKLWEKSQHGVMNRGHATNYLGQIANVPKNLRPIIIKELGMLGFIQVKKFSIVVKKPKDHEDLIKKLERRVGLY